MIQPRSDHTGRHRPHEDRHRIVGPTDTEVTKPLPWGLEIDADKIVAAGYAPGTLFHPTFLYESLWNFGLAALLVAIGWRFMYRQPARLLALYCIGYGIGRFWIEGLRIDPTKEGGGLRLNQWTAIILVVGGLAYFLYCRIRYRRSALGASTMDQVPSFE